MNGERLGRRIEQLRTAQRMSRATLAEKAGLDRSDLWRIEKGLGPKSIGIDRLERIARALKVPLASLFETPTKTRGTSRPRSLNA